MAKFWTIISASLFLVFFGVSVFADNSGMGQSGKQSQSQTKGAKSDKKAQETQDTTPKELETEEQKAARPGEAGEKGDVSIFGSSATQPPTQDAPSYTGADKEAEQQERNLQKERKKK